ncbi:hypothetical protein [Microbacterium sp. P02]|uniref:hypothetical protein n=1 Tax=Microbacterium sp. P02 TaxID=3366260 RepID=UPI003670BD4A
MMTNAQRRYERILRWYPRSWRVQHEQVMLGTLLDMDDARGRSGPTVGEAWSLRLDGLRRRLVPTGGERVSRRRTITFAAVAAVIVGCVSVGGLTAAALPSLMLSADERNELFAACMNAKGWDSRVEGDGVVSSSPAEQNEQFLADGQSCATSTNPMAATAPTAKQLQGQYANLLEAQKCIAELGYETPAAPDEATFLATLGTWSPFAALPNISAAEFTKLEQACPQPNLEP